MPSIALEHHELVRAVQEAMAQQLRRDGRLNGDAELGLVFFTDRGNDLRVKGIVRRAGETLWELSGGRTQLSAIATELALSKLPPRLHRSLQSTAVVRWRALRFVDENEEVDRFAADVEFNYKA